MPAWFLIIQGIVSIVKTIVDLTKPSDSAPQEHKDAHAAMAGKLDEFHAAAKSADEVMKA